MQRRFAVLVAALSGALAAVVAVPFVAGSHRHQTFVAGDAQAAAAAAAPTQEIQRQQGAMPSLSPLVKQVRGTVVNISSRFKPRPVTRARRGMPQAQPQQPFGGGDEGQGQDDGLSLIHI